MPPKPYDRPPSSQGLPSAPIRAPSPESLDAGQRAISPLSAIAQQQAAQASGTGGFAAPSTALVPTVSGSAPLAPSSYGTMGAFPAQSMLQQQQMFSPYGQQGVMGPGGFPNNKLFNGGYSILQGMQSSMDSFGRVSQSLQMTFDALHLSLNSVLRLVTNATLLKHEFVAILRTFTTFRLLHLAALKLRKMANWLLSLFRGREATLQRATHLDLSESWVRGRDTARSWGPTTRRIFHGGQMVDVPIPASQLGMPGELGGSSSSSHAAGGPPNWGWLPTVFYLTAAWWLGTKLYRFIRARYFAPPPPKLAPGQQQRQRHAIAGMAGIQAQQQQQQQQQGQQRGGAVGAVPAAAQQLQLGPPVMWMDSPQGPIPVYSQAQLPQQTGSMVGVGGGGLPSAAAGASPAALMRTGSLPTTTAAASSTTLPAAMVRPGSVAGIRAAALATPLPTSTMSAPAAAGAATFAATAAGGAPVAPAEEAKRPATGAAAPATGAAASGTSAPAMAAVASGIAAATAAPTTVSAAIAGASAQQQQAQLQQQHALALQHIQQQTASSAASAAGYSAGLMGAAAAAYPGQQYGTSSMYGAASTMGLSPYSSGGMYSAASPYASSAYGGAYGSSAYSPYASSMYSPSSYGYGGMSGLGSHGGMSMSGLGYGGSIGGLGYGAGAGLGYGYGGGGFM